MKIGYAIEAIHLYGGTTRSTYEIATHLPNPGEVVFFVKGAELPTGHPFQIETIAPCGWSALIKNITFAWKTYRRSRGLNIDILNAVGTASFRQDVVTAQSVHKKWFFFSLQTTSVWSLGFWKKIFNPAHYVTMLIESIQYHPANHKHVIAISNQVKMHLIEQFGLPPERISVVHHGVNCAEFHPASRDLARKKIRNIVGMKDDDYVAIFAAHEFKRKGLSVLLRAMAVTRIPNLKLLVVGQDKPEPYLEMIRELGLQGRVYFAGLQKNLFEWYAASDVFAFPTMYEAFGLVTTEAMAAGLPVIVPVDTGASELLTNGVDSILLSRWDHVEECAEALKMLQDETLRQKMGLEARKTAEGCTWEKASAKTYAVYQKVFEEKSLAAKR